MFLYFVEVYACLLSPMAPVTQHWPPFSLYSSLSFVSVRGPVRKGTGFGWALDLHQREWKPGSHAYTDRCIC